MLSGREYWEGRKNKTPSIILGNVAWNYSKFTIELIKIKYSLTFIKYIGKSVSANEFSVETPPLLPHLQLRKHTESEDKLLDFEFNTSLYIYILKCCWCWCYCCNSAIYFIWNLIPAPQTEWIFSVKVVNFVWCRSLSHKNVCRTFFWRLFVNCEMKYPTTWSDSSFIACIQSNSRYLIFLFYLQSTFSLQFSSHSICNQPPSHQTYFQITHVYESNQSFGILWKTTCWNYWLLVDTYLIVFYFRVSW